MDQIYIEMLKKSTHYSCSRIKLIK